jgi:SAM-dependent methyltransferase
MPIIMGLETTFNEVAVEYDTWRPTYVPELYQDIFACKEIDDSSHVLEVGIGTGQATKPFLETQCHLTAVELGDNLAAYSRQKYKEFSKFDVRNCSFQDFEGRENSFDLIYSASAFHWIPEDIGYPKVYTLLRNGGIFAQFANHPYRDKENDALHMAMQQVYARYMPHSQAEPEEYSEEQCREKADTMTHYGFVDVTWKMYHRTRTFDAQAYVSLISTYSDHRAINAEQRVKFLQEIHDVIHHVGFGGQITIYDTIDLQLARKR